VVLPGFRDLTGDPSTSLQVNFARVPTRSIEFSSLSPGDVLSDEIDESFDFGGSSPLSFQDSRVLFDTPTAEWGGGQLTAAFSFEGTGGPGGNFDWIVRQGELFFFDTTGSFIVGGPNGVPTTTLHAVNGVVDVRNLTVERGGEIRVQGPNPMRINASGEVRIDGRLDLSGFPGKDVATLNTGNLVEVGGAGAAGGGNGGDANRNTTGPTPRGGRGRGPFGALGGEGGEMGYSRESSKNARRPGGGGGGRLAKDWIGVQPPPNLSLVAGPGSDGNPRSTGAESGLSPARGGAPGEGPFLDGRDDNDFFGVRPVASEGELVGLVRGELPGLWAGYGGGGGGNAGRVFPNPNWTFNSDEKGGGGGGAGGGLHLKALGRIVFGRTGLILASGARGGAGENTNFLDHIGGTGGGGSGGHVVLESATAVDFTDGGAAVNDAPRAAILAAGAARKIGPTQDVDTCGQAPAHCCPAGCIVQSNGGPGGAGLIQIHVPDPVRPPGTATPARILVPAAALDATDVMGKVTSPPAYIMTPTFGRRSKARSKWISIGGADRRPDGTEGLVRFLFEGIDPVTGRILTNGSTVLERTPLWTDDDLRGSASARILPDGLTLELSGAALTTIRAGSTSGISNDIYLRTPALLEECAVRLRVVTAPSNFEDFSIARAMYDEGAAPVGDETLRMTVSGTRRLTAFNPGSAAGQTGVQLLPRFFRVVTNGLPDSLPATAFVSLRFQATTDNGNGAPEETSPLWGWTSDISEFNALPAGALQYLRYEVEFDLDSDGSGPFSLPAPVSLDFLKIPFVF
jgi:hypothetical protein